ncbi:phenylalanine--tRNA ligase subunit beta [Haploplasma axanthum]|uniref:Phenylalanine--tRNA ligase beta subunit n=1 Tax=Haploplasma axanthum TaxID=29552 RepID=A0A449BCX9_HAPAX|nr:phenylalanine--tRNA ligase subunit beta [Haploplasma axanthum]VEU80277.1 EMAP domain-containing protein [Haploplasma axanthum]
MKIVENNLKQFIDVPNNIDEVTNAYITEVESFGLLSNINNVLIGHVLEKEKHENADSLSVTKVDLGNGRIEQIVCGAKNVAKGQYVIVATEGAVLPGDFVIKKSKIRGVESNGMICSLKELGFDEKLIPEEFKSGIYYFDEPKEVGTNALSHLAMDGFVLELSLTPNRSDLLSHYGFAQDLAAATNKKIVLPNFNVKENETKNPLTVKIDSKNTNKYFARYLNKVEVKDSPWWLKSFLLAVDCQPINNVVDITNYILYTYGTPMHAFDAKKFGTKEIVVSDNTKKLKVKTLDGIERELTGDEIVITNGKEVMALGGVMGLENSMIDDNTDSIILEIASFKPESIKNTSKKIGLKSDSSLRFERGIDEEIIEQALRHASYLLETLANASITKGIVSDVKNSFKNPFIDLTEEEISRKIGHKLSGKEIVAILERLNYEVKVNKNVLTVKAPSYRHDILMKDDCLEEIVRIYGMNNIPNQPLTVSGVGALTKKQKTNRTLRHYLANIGFNEVVTYSLRKENEVTRFNELGNVISILKPQNVERKALRQSLINGLIDVVKYNKDHGVDGVNLFEMGHVYADKIERNYLTLMASSSTINNLWKKTNIKLDFYFVSGILKNIMGLLKVDYELVPSNNQSFHPYQQASIVVNKQTVGIIGKIHPKLSVKDNFVFEIDLDSLEKQSKFKYQQVSKYPSVERDLAIVLKDDIKVGDVVKLIEQTVRKNIIKTEVFDIYKGSHIEEGYQSVAVRMVFNDENKTLESADVDKLVNKVAKRIEFEFQGKIRS